MRSSILLGAAFPLAHAIRIIHGNDDGWAEVQVRTFFNSLTAAGHQVVLSAPAENQSGTGKIS
jgi:broad specificity polyphosphatase/5'/3'-nucleotidase SurE